MRIVIDMQGAQTESRFRGIGRYTLSFTKALIRNRQDHDVILALNGCFTNTIELIRQEFKGLLPDENIKVWQVPFPVNESDERNLWRHAAAEIIRKAYLASLNPDVLHITSLFEGFSDNSVTGVGLDDYIKDTITTVSLYDLIPLLNMDQYLGSPDYKKYYMRKIELLKSADALLSISEFSRNEAISALGLDEASTINISTAADDSFRKEDLTDEEESNFRQNIGLTKSMILYTGGSDERKNLHSLVKVYARLPDWIRKDYQLVFAGKMSETHIGELNKIAAEAGLLNNELLFTGYISEIDLREAYNLAKLFVFPSKHEGFGLPVLEAIKCGTPVIASNVTSIPEIITHKEALFNPYSEDDIYEHLLMALEDDKYLLSLQRAQFESTQMITWDMVALNAIHSFESLTKNIVKTVESEDFVEKNKNNAIEEISKLTQSNRVYSDNDVVMCAYCIDLIRDSHED